MTNSLVAGLRQLQQKDILWSDKYLSKTAFHPTFWVTSRIDDALKANANFAHGVLLDVGCGIKPYEAIFDPYVTQYLGLEYAPGSGYRGNKADFCGDAASLPLCDESVDTILCTEVLEHVPDPERTIEEFARVLRPGGVLITTAPFVYPIHDTHDYFRYGPKGLAAIMQRYGLKVEKTDPLSGTAVTLAVMVNIYCYDVGFMWTKWLYPIGLILRPFLLLFCLVNNVLGGIFEVILPSDHLSFNHLTLAKKPQCGRDGTNKNFTSDTNAI